MSLNDDDKTWINERLDDAFTRFSQHILHEVGTRFDEVNQHLARIDARLDRQGFMLSGGTQALGGLLEHVTRVDSGYEKVLGEMSELRGRIERLEKMAS